LHCNNCEKGNTIMRRPLPSTRLRHLGAIAALAAVVVATSVGLQAHADTGLDTQTRPLTSSYDVAMTIEMHGRTTTPHLTVGLDRPFAVAGETDGKPWRVEFTLQRTADKEQLRFTGKITEGGALIAAPVLVGALGQRLAVQVGADVNDTVRVALVARGA
jgi:hypothetical protein